MSATDQENKHTAPDARARLRPGEPSEALDWLGSPVDCATCAWREGIRAQGLCKPMVACVHDRYAKRIERFLDTNPEASDAVLAHPYFEVRAIATKHASIFRLPALLNDPDPEVRAGAVMRLPARQGMRLRTDPDRKVRVAVAARLTGPDLVPLSTDDDYYVRMVVARRLPHDMLPLMMHDPEAEVRRAVARRIGEEWLMAMAWDVDPLVRLDVARRLSAQQLAVLIEDPDMRVRHAVAERIDPRHLSALAADDDPLVAEMARDRLQRLDREADGTVAAAAPPATGIVLAVDASRPGNGGSPDA
ncbi:LRV (FeS)4 cluster domain protein [Caenispirillum salinarum AK4]|uniref:LRV (FeS)4 cluster domain protein n=1 Tax=Caenispirillum salinarum AK4 TaxID=1238182 RepID=K9H170_9PROT|nr:4Fe4S-binding leucine-rich repeat protein [Caenispirillum salinarum]EKV31297.1 LRV (FeS)4 cluster domain protein [Caenispirillum salinarum AK4]